MKDKLKVILPIIIAIILAIAAAVDVNTKNDEPSGDYIISSIQEATAPAVTIDAQEAFDFSAIPEYNGSAYVILNDNVPDFIEADLTEKSFEYYGSLDNLGRCTACYACIGKDIMPTEKRGNISSVKPTGWHSSRYEFVDGESLYNRCHLIGYQLTGENANEKNLITGTRYLNVNGMLPFEEKVAEYVKSGKGHILYRVTPRFYNNELVARGVQMEGISVEDEGDSVCFNVYCYNVQPGVEIDYATGDNHLAGEDETKTESGEVNEYVLNTKSKKFHKTDCEAVENIKSENKRNYSGTRQSLIDSGFEPCGQCQP